MGKITQEGEADDHGLIGSRVHGLQYAIAIGEDTREGDRNIGLV